ncbi:MAG: putative small protein [Planctomycetota bacterium]|jgi:hypothetical protein
MSDSLRPDDPRAPSTGAAADDGRTTAAITKISDALRGLRYGSVLAIVQDGVVVQIERTEKTRLDKTAR